MYILYRRIPETFLSNLWHLPNCVEYWELNTIAVKPRYSLPLFKKTLRQLSRTKRLTRMEIKSAFHRIQISEGDEWLTAFWCRLGWFELLVTVFGLGNLPWTFHRYITDQLCEHLDKNTTAYMENLLVYTSNIEKIIGR